MRARLWRQNLSLASPITAAGQIHDTRTHLFLELEIDGVRGLGEISPQPFELNGDAGLQDVVNELEHFTLRQFVEAAQREARAPHWARVTHFAGSRPASNPASALLEMALLDVHLRDRNSTIDEQWPAHFETPVQTTVSLMDEHHWAPVLGVAQIRAKISPKNVPTAQWSRLAALERPVLLDFNCSGSSIEDVLSVVNQAQSHLNVVAIEQPFAPGNVVEHARLAVATDVPISLDEGVRHRRDLDQIARYHAARIVCIKPARVGGYAQARTMIERAHHLGLEVYLGGFFESPLARHANRALARHYLSRPSDIANAVLNETELLSPDAWGYGFLPGSTLESTQPLLSRLW